MDDSKAVARLLVHADGSVTFDTDEVRLEVNKVGIRIFSKNGTSISIGDAGFTVEDPGPKGLN